MADTTTQQTAGPLQLLESGAAGYCDPVTGLCVLPAALPEVRADPDTTTLPGHAEKVVVPGLHPVAD
jgi:hypothetical protein